MAISDFVKGFTGTVLSEWEKRDVDEREMKKVRMLEQLRRETSDYEFKRRAAYEESAPNDKASGADYEAGKYIVRDAKGRTVSERPLTSSEMEDRRMSTEAASLDTQYKRASIDNIGIDNAFKREEIDLRRADLADRGAERAARKAESGGGSDGTSTAYDRADALMQRYKNEVKMATDAGATPTEIRAGAVALAENSRTGGEAQQKFLEFIGRRTSKAGGYNPDK